MHFTGTALCLIAVMVLASLAFDERCLGFPSRDALIAGAALKPTARFTLSNIRASILHGNIQLYVLLN